MTLSNLRRIVLSAPQITPAFMNQSQTKATQCGGRNIKTDNLQYEVAHATT